MLFSARRMDRLAAKCGAAEDLATALGTGQVDQIERKFENAVGVAASLQAKPDPLGDLGAGQRSPLSVKRCPARLDVGGIGYPGQETGFGNRFPQALDRALDEPALPLIGAFYLTQDNGNGHR